MKKNKYVFMTNIFSRVIVRSGTSHLTSLVEIQYFIKFTFLFSSISKVESQTVERS